MKKLVCKKIPESNKPGCYSIAIIEPVFWEIGKVAYVPDTRTQDTTSEIIIAGEIAAIVTNHMNGYMGYDGLGTQTIEAQNGWVIEFKE